MNQSYYNPDPPSPHGATATAAPQYDTRPPARSRTPSDHSRYHSPPRSRYPYSQSDDEAYYQDRGYASTRGPRSGGRRTRSEDSLPPYQEHEQSTRGTSDGKDKHKILKVGLIAGAMVVAVGALSVWHKKQVAARELHQRERKRKDFDRAKRRRRRDEENRERQLDMMEEEEGSGARRRIEYMPEDRPRNRTKSRGRGDRADGDVRDGRDHQRATSRV